MTWERVGAGHTAVWMESGHVATVVKSSIVIRKATLFNVCMYVCMHIRAYMRVIAYECSNGHATCKQHVTRETTVVRIM